MGNFLSQCLKFEENNHHRIELVGIKSNAEALYWAYFELNVLLQRQDELATLVLDTPFQQSVTFSSSLHIMQLWSLLDMNSAEVLVQLFRCSPDRYSMMSVSQCEGKPLYEAREVQVGNQYRCTVTVRSFRLLLHHLRCLVYQHVNDANVAFSTLYVDAYSLREELRCTSGKNAFVTLPELHFSIPVVGSSSLFRHLTDEVSIFTSGLVEASGAVKVTDIPTAVLALLSKAAVGPFAAFQQLMRTPLGSARLLSHSTLESSGDIVADTTARGPNIMQTLEADDAKAEGSDFTQLTPRLIVKRMKNKVQGKLPIEQSQKKTSGIDIKNVTERVEPEDGAEENELAALLSARLEVDLRKVDGMSPLTEESYNLYLDSVRQQHRDSAQQWQQNQAKQHEKYCDVDLDQKFFSEFRSLDSKTRNIPFLASQQHRNSVDVPRRWQQLVAEAASVQSQNGSRTSTECVHLALIEEISALLIYDAVSNHDDVKREITVPELHSLLVNQMKSCDFSFSNVRIARSVGQDFFSILFEIAGTEVCITAKSSTCFVLEEPYCVYQTLQALLADVVSREVADVKKDNMGPLESTRIETSMPTDQFFTKEIPMLVGSPWKDDYVKKIDGPAAAEEAPVHDVNNSNFLWQNWRRRKARLFATAENEKLQWRKQAEHQKHEVQFVRRVQRGVESTGTISHDISIELDDLDDDEKKLDATQVQTPKKAGAIYIPQHTASSSQRIGKLIKYVPKPPRLTRSHIEQRWLTKLVPESTFANASSVSFGSLDGEKLAVDEKPNTTALADFTSYHRLGSRVFGDGDSDVAIVIQTCADVMYHVEFEPKEDEGVDIDQDEFSMELLLSCPKDVSFVQSQWIEALRPPIVYSRALFALTSLLQIDLEHKVTVKRLIKQNIFQLLYDLLHSRTQPVAIRSKVTQVLLHISNDETVAMQMRKQELLVLVQQELALLIPQIVMCAKEGFQFATILCLLAASLYLKFAISSSERRSVNSMISHMIGALHSEENQSHQSVDKSCFESALMYLIYSASRSKRSLGVVCLPSFFPSVTSFFREWLKFLSFISSDADPRRLQLGHQAILFLVGACYNVRYASEVRDMMPEVLSAFNTVLNALRQEDCPHPLLYSKLLLALVMLLRGVTVQYEVPHDSLRATSESVMQDLLSIIATLVQNVSPYPQGLPFLHLCSELAPIGTVAGEGSPETVFEVDASTETHSMYSASLAKESVEVHQESGNNSPYAGTLLLIYHTCEAAVKIAEAIDVTVLLGAIPMLLRLLDLDSIIATALQGDFVALSENNTIIQRLRGDAAKMLRCLCRSSTSVGPVLQNNGITRLLKCMKMTELVSLESTCSQCLAELCAHKNFIHNKVMVGALMKLLPRSSYELTAAACLALGNTAKHDNDTADFVGSLLLPIFAMMMKFLRSENAELVSSTGFLLAELCHLQRLADVITEYNTVTILLDVAKKWTRHRLVQRNCFAALHALATVPENLHVLKSHEGLPGVIVDFLRAPSLKNEDYVVVLSLCHSICVLSVVALRMLKVNLQEWLIRLLGSPSEQIQILAGKVMAQLRHHYNGTITTLKQ